MNSTSRESLHSFRTNVPGNNMNPSVLHTGMDKIAKSNQSRKGDLNANQLWGSLTRSVINFAFFFSCSQADVNTKYKIDEATTKRATAAIDFHVCNQY